MGTLELKNVNKSFNNQEVIKNLNLKINDGERIVFLGPSGCGKSTILRMISGIENVTSGEILFDGKNMTQTPPGNRDVAMVFQNYALYPHMTVQQNITYALKHNKVAANEIASRLEKVLKILDLSHLKFRKPNELSGGQRQRVALARAVVKNSKYFLLDEPLSNLDALLRTTARRELIHLHQIYKHTFIFVTHDQLEAMSIADKIVLFNKGEIQMYDTPEKIYNSPQNVFTAKFIGSPPMNIIKGRYINDKIEFGDKSFIHINNKIMDILKPYENKEILVGIRPEHINISETPSSISFQVNDIENLGEAFSVIGNIGVQEIVVKTINNPTEQNTFLNFDLEQINFFDPITEKNIKEF